MSTTDDSAEHECPTCGRDDFANEHGLNIHRSQSHTDDKPWHDPERLKVACETFETVEEITDEWDCSREAVVDAIQRFEIGVQCPTCEKHFLRDKGMRIHHTHAHGESLRQTVTDECAVCGDVFEHPDTLDQEYCSPECFHEHRRDRVVVECSNCGGSIEKIPATVSVHNLCSPECDRQWRSEYYSGEGSPAWKGGLVEVECACCGAAKRVKRAIAKARERHYCNSDCYGEWLSANRAGENSPTWKGGDVLLECEWCGDDYPIKRSHAEGSRFCGVECQSRWASEHRVGEASPTWKGGHTKYRGENWHKQRRKARRRDGHMCQRCGTTREAEGRNLDVHHITPFREFESWMEANQLDNLVTLCHSCHMEIEADL